MSGRMTWLLLTVLSGLLASCVSPASIGERQPAAASPAPATPLPSAEPVRAVLLRVSPATAEIYVAPPRGLAPSFPYAIQLQAEVVYSDGSVATPSEAIIWESSEGDRARVDEQGLVTAGLEPGVVTIEAELEGLAAEVSITVRDDSSAEVVVD